MQSAPVYTVPTLHVDVQESDCIEDMINALRQLHRVQNNMFEAIEKRLGVEQNKYNSIMERIQTAKTKVDAIMNLRGGRATTLFSSARFPAPPGSTERAFQPIFGGMEDYERKTGFEDFDDEDRQHFPGNTNPISAPPSTSELLDLLWRANQVDDQHRFLTSTGLGTLPQHLESVSSILVFNSNEMPYKKYDETLDNIFEHMNTREKGDDESKKKEMFAQGQTLLKGDDLPAVAALDMTYKPKMKEQPMLQFQTNLDFGSELPAVAVDASWQGAAETQDSSIAPTVFQASLPALPSIADSIPSPTATQRPSNAPQLTNGSGTGTAASMNAPPQAASAAPPPPPPPMANTAPPPPPPLPTATVQPAAPAAKVPEGVPKAVAAPSRGGLLDAIRNAGGAKALKGKKPKPRKEQSAPAPKKAAPMSLADEMRMKLQRRANIMSGREDKAEQAAAKKRRPTLKAAPKEDEDAGAGGFSTKNMGGLAALLKSKETAKPRVDSFDDEESDWDSD
jgi:hypothetical protein